jgi:hypothetical protein
MCGHDVPPACTPDRVWVSWRPISSHLCRCVLIAPRRVPRLRPSRLRQGATQKWAGGAVRAGEVGQAAAAFKTPKLRQEGAWHRATGGLGHQARPQPAGSIDHLLMTATARPRSVCSRRVAQRVSLNRWSGAVYEQVGRPSRCSVRNTPAPISTGERAWYRTTASPRSRGTVLRARPAADGDSGALALWFRP